MRSEFFFSIDLVSRRGVEDGDGGGEAAGEVRMADSMCRW